MRKRNYKNQSGSSHIWIIVLLIVMIAVVLGITFWNSINGSKKVDQVVQGGIAECPAKQVADKNGYVAMLVDAKSNECIRVKIPTGWKIKKSQDTNYSDTITFDYSVSIEPTEAQGKDRTYQISGINGSYNVSFSLDDKNETFSSAEVLDTVTNNLSKQKIYVVDSNSSENENVIRLSSCEPKSDFSSNRNSFKSSFYDKSLCSLEVKHNTQKKAIKVVLWNRKGFDGLEITDPNPSEQDVYKQTLKDFNEIAVSLDL